MSAHQLLEHQTQAKAVFPDSGCLGSRLGKTVVLDHGHDYSTVYARMGEIIVQQGEKVAKGQLIARVGNGGLTRSPTLHFEIRKSQKPENPFYYFSE